MQKLTKEDFVFLIFEAFSVAVFIGLAIWDATQENWDGFALDIAIAIGFTILTIVVLKRDLRKREEKV